MTLEKLYRKFRIKSPFMLVGSNADQALKAARLLIRWEELEAAGLVRIRSEFDTDPDASFYDTWSHLSQRTKEELKQDYYDDCYVVIAEYRADEADEWEMADSIGGCAGYADPESPFENCYVIDLMQSAIERHEEASIGHPLAI